MASSRFYYDRICKSTSAVLRQKHLDREGTVAWPQCPELTDIYSGMKPASSAPDFSGIAAILAEHPSDRTGTNPGQDALGVIAETRRHPHLESVTRNFIQQTGLNVHLFHGSDNLEYILSGDIGKYVETGQVTLQELRTETLDGPMYSALLLTRPFWEAMIGRGKIFVFQVDSWICRQSRFKLNRFLQFDYIGSRWRRKRPTGLILDGGSGGLSIRDWRKSVQCLEMFPPSLWRGGEDGYFAFHIELMGGKVGRRRDCGRFSTQDFFSHKSYGAHSISRLPEAQQQKFTAYCPEAEFLLEQNAPPGLTAE